MTGHCKECLRFLAVIRETLSVPVFRGPRHSEPGSLRNRAYSHLEERVS